MKLRLNVRKCHAVVFLSGLAVAYCLVFSGVAQAIEQGGIGGRPAHPQSNNNRSQSIFVHKLAPGQQAKDGVQVINNTAETRKVLVYAVDSQTSSGGVFACAQAADKPISVGGWIALERQEVVLAPKDKQTIAFTVSVPKQAAAGEHDGCIVIQETEQRAVPNRNGIALSLRSAIRVAITVPGDIQKGLVFSGLGFEPRGNDALLLSTALKNSGNVSLDTQLKVRLLYAFGFAAANVGGSFPVLSGSEGRFNFEAERPFWGGWYRLAATAAYNDAPNVALGEGKSTATITRSSWIYIAPQPIALMLEGTALLLLIGGITVFTLKRRAHKRALRTAGSHIVKQHEDLHTIATAHHMSWRQLARMNALKPPYQLKTGQKLLVIQAKKTTDNIRHQRP